MGFIEAVSCFVAFKACIALKVCVSRGLEKG